VSIAALGLAVLSAYGANRMVKSQRRCREPKMRRLARAAVEMTMPFDLPGILDNDEFIKVCAQLSEDNEEEKEEREKKGGEIRARLEFYTFQLARIHAAIACHTGRKGWLHPTWWLC
jgi:nitrogenase molybdenum-iron protein alpha/beta subunit